MKKILISFLMITISFTFFSQNTYALDNTSDTYDESFYLVNNSYEESDFLFNDSSAIWSDMYLSENTFDKVTFLLSDVLSQISPREGFEVDSITLKINFSMTTTSENITIQTNDNMLVKQVHTYDTYDSTQFALNIDVDDYESTIDHSSEFSYNGTSTTAIKVGSSFLEVVYVKSEGGYNNTIECASDYSLIPNTNSVFLDIITIEEYDAQSHSHKLSFSYGSTLYYFNVAIPDDIYNHVYSSEWDDSIYFTDIQAYQMSIATSPEGEHVLYIQPDKIKSNKPSILDDGDSPDIVGFASINLTSMEYKVINKLELIGIVNKEDSRYASLYCFFPARIEELLSITVSYDYRINTIFSKGSWESVMNTYVAGDSYNGETPSWVWWIPGAGWGWASAGYLTGNYIYDIENVIEPITRTEVPAEVEYKYVNDLGGRSSDLNNQELYKISLGQFQDGFFTAFSDDKAYDIQELAILNILYVFEGKVYEATTEDIESIVLTPELSETPFDLDQKDIELIIIVVIIIIGLYFISKLRLDKNPLMLLIVVGTAVYIIYRLGLF